MSVYQIINLVSRTLLAHYLLIWVLVFAAAFAWAFTRRLAPGPAIERPQQPGGLRISWGEIVAVMAFALFLAGYIALIFYHADFADFDDSIVALPIVGAHEDVSSVWPHLGRFFPLGNQEWTLLRQVTTSPFAYHAFAVLELLVLVALVFHVMRELAVRTRVQLLGLLLLTPSFLIVFAGLIYPERDLLLLVVVFIACLQSWSVWPTRWRLFAALAVTHVALYLKEPVFLLVGGVAVLRLALAWYEAPRGDRSIRRLLAAHPLEMGILALAAIYLALYVGIMLPTRSTRYTAIGGEPLGVWATLWVFLRSDPVLVVFLVAVALRFYSLIRARRPPDALWDPLALGALLYTCTYFWLGMRRPYYTAPLDLVGILYVGRLTRTAIQSGLLRRRMVAAAALGLAVLLTCQSWFVLVEKKNAIRGKARIAAYIAEYVRSVPMRPVPLFLPHRPGFQVMEFASYLEFRGIRVERDPRQGDEPPDVTLTSPRTFKKDLCVDWVPYRCTRADGPAPGGLALVLPDDQAADAGTESLRPAATLAFSYQPWIEPAVLVPFLRSLRRIMDPGWRRLYRRSDWLWGYVWRG